MRRLFSFLLTTFMLSCSLHAQMWNGQDTLYGNEWINFDQQYFKISVAEDGMYRIPFSELQNAGIPVGSINTGQFQLFHLGREVPMYISASGSILNNGDFIEFFGKKNRSEIDRFLFANPDDMLNPYYSLFSDTAAYFLTWTETENGLRYETIANVLSNLPPKEEWYWQEEQLIFTDRQVQKTYSEGVAESVFEKGEGFASQFSNSISSQIPLTDTYLNTTEKAVYKVRLVSSTGYTHNLQISVNNDIQVEENFSGFEFKTYQFDKPISALNATEQININGGTTNNDRYAIASISCTYPSRFNFQGADIFQFSLNQKSVSQYLEIENFNTNGPAVLYDFQKNKRINAISENGLIKIKVAPTDENAQFLLQNVNSGWQEALLSPVNFIDYSSLNADYIILSNKKLYDDGQGNNWVQQYADYRSSVQGGDHEVVTVEIGQLFDQFAYGIPQHPISIRNYSHFVKKYWADANFLLIIGKGRQYDFIRTPAQLASPENQSYYVPTFGKPGSDNLLLASTTSQAPVLAVGRIAASKAIHVKYYLDKIKAHESEFYSSNENNRDWRKEMIHLGGGGSPSEQLTLKNHLKQMQGIIENNEIGGNVFSFYKTNSAPIQQSQSDDLTGRINAGASIITFFGHSGTGGFDFSIDDPTTYQNQGKYPFMISLGCFSGQIHLDFQSVGEKFIFQEEKAALGFLATTGLGYIYPLATAGKKIYDHLGTDFYGKGIGEVLQKTMQELDDVAGIPTRTLVQQLTLDGDPAMVLSPFGKPDYRFDVASVKFTPNVIDAQRDSFELQFTIQNIGRALSDSFQMKIIRQFPDQSQVVIKKIKIKAPFYSSNFSFKFPVNGTRAIGSNRFFIRLDSEDEIEEGPLPYAEDNNELTDRLGIPGIELFVLSSRVSALSPVEFDIVGSNPVTIKGVTADPFAEAITYIVQIDTTAHFDSPSFRETNINIKGGLIEWTADIPWMDSTVYYWRISADSTDGFGYLWDNSSFLYLQDSPPGWNQSHYFQYVGDYFENMEINEQSRTLNYLEDVKFVRILNGVFPAVWPGINFNNTPYGYIAWNESTNGGIYIAVMDSITVDPWLNNPPGLYGSRLDNSWAYGWGVFPYSTQTEEQREKVINFLRDTIPSGNYIAVYTIQHDNENYQPEEWAIDSINLGTNLFQILENQGATQIRQKEETGALPYVFVYKKDDVSFTPIEMTGNLNEPLEVVFDIPGIWESGAIKTQKIGPASSWDLLQWKNSQQEPLDEVKLDIFGIRNDASKQLLVENVSSLETDLNWISSEEFPFLQLRYFSKDSLLRTAPQLDFWRVLYEGIPEAVINPNKYFVFQNDTLQQGEPLKLEFTVENISRYDMDSLLISFMITDETNNIILTEKRFQPLPGKEALTADFRLDTRQLSGRHNMIIEVNPHNDQPEQNHANNIGLLDFYVERDKRNPLLDVTFDSERILDGDLVSAKPHIVISLQDENRYLALSDTTELKILIKKPGAADVSPVYFNTPSLQFFPADEDQLNQQNKATVEFDPQFSENGIYELVVQGEDATGNQSGAIDYKVSFEVITETSLSNILNYPNPFTHSTRFVYTLTGDEPPPYFSIQIMTVSGRIVRTLTQADLGPLKPGTHQTEYSWNGTDEFGDRLANGVYIYKVTAKDENGQALDQFKNESTDRFFEKGYGKMVILR